jgi:hypothetical protein
MSNERTVRAYEGYARTYAHHTAGTPTGMVRDGLDRFAAAVGAKGHVLEVGSGPGWDADNLESLGVGVRRTDVTLAFRELQAERGHRVEALDVLVDDLGGPWAGVMALCVLQHVDRDRVDGVLERIASALGRDAVLLVSLPEGEGERSEGESGDYHVVFWSLEAWRESLRRVGLQIEWNGRTVYDEGPWFTVLARKVR